MIALIAEKPSVAKDIARIIGATGRNDGYLSGNGYMVTWALPRLDALPHLVEGEAVEARVGCGGGSVG